MSNLFTGLEQLGLGSLESVHLYEEEETPKEEKKQVAVKTPEAIEEELLFDKSYTCPVCDIEFKVRAVKTGKAKLLSVDSDLRPKYKDVDSLKYDSIACPQCGYAALSRFFNYLTSSQIKFIKTGITPNFRGIDAKLEIYSYDEAILRHQLALLNTKVKKGKISEIAYTCLKTAWLFRGKRESLPQDTPDYQKTCQQLEATENEFIKNAYTGFKEALSKEIFPICGMDENTYYCLVADLGRKTKDYAYASRLIGEVIVAKNAPEKLKERARTIRNHIKQDMEAEKK